MPYNLTVESSPVSVRIGQQFTVHLSTDYVPRRGQQVYCTRSTDFEYLENLWDIPLVGPESVWYSNGNFVFRAMKFEGDMVFSSPWTTDGQPPKTLWPVDFSLVVDGRVRATARVNIAVTLG